MALADILQSCSTAFRAGIQEFYVNSACNITAATASTTNQSFTAITTSSDWVKVEGDVGTMSLDVAPGTKGAVTVTAVAEFEGLDKTLLFSLQEIVNTRRVSILVVTNNSAGTYPKAFLLGYDSIRGNNSYLNPQLGGMIEADIVEGANKATLTLTGTMLEFPREMVGTIAYNSGTVSFGS